MPVSSRGSHAGSQHVVDDDFQRLLKKEWKPAPDPEREFRDLWNKNNRPPESDFDRLMKKPYIRREPSGPRVPKVVRRTLGRIVGNPVSNLAPYIPPLWDQGPRPVAPAGFRFHGPCMRMQSNIEFYRWIGTAITSDSCLNGQAVGGAPTGGVNENHADDASYNIIVPQMGSGYAKRGYFGVYHVSGTTWRGQHRLSVEQFAGMPALSAPMQTYPTRMPTISPMADPNNWPLSPSNGGPEAGKPVFPEPEPKTDPLGFGGGGSLVVETGTGPIGVAILTPGQQVKPGYLGPVAPPGKGVKEAGKRRTSARLGRLLFKALDDISESCEVVDALYDALPNDVKKSAMKKAGYVWSPSAGKYVLPGDGSLKASDKTTEAFRPSGAGSRSFVDQFGQYGLDGCDWKAQALYDHADKLDVCGGVQNILKNYLEDKIHGVTHRFRPKNTVNGLADADKEFGLQLNNLLDEVLDLCPK